MKLPYVLCRASSPHFFEMSGVQFTAEHVFARSFRGVNGSAALRVEETPGAQLDVWGKARANERYLSLDHKPWLQLDQCLAGLGRFLEKTPRFWVVVVLGGEQGWMGGKKVGRREGCERVGG